MSENKKETINRLLTKTAEVITDEEFLERIESGNQLTHYIGFEISGYVHIGQGIMSALVMKDLTDLGVKCTVWLADWHTAINKKLDGTKDTAMKIGEGYFTEAIKACYKSVGGNPEDLEFRLASTWYAEHPDYWSHVIETSQNTTLARMLRSIDIMGREAGDNIDHARTMYPAMQVADIFSQDIDIAHSSMDQRKAHVIMRDVAEKVRPDHPKPIAIHHALIDGLTGEEKMSKSKPDSAVFIHDTEEEISSKIKKAFCPEKKVEKNPVLNWTRNIIFWNRTESFKITRKEEHGGDIEFNTYSELEKAFADGDVHPMDLKATVAQEIASLLAPAREHFEQAYVASKKQELDNILANR